MHVVYIGDFQLEKSGPWTCMQHNICCVRSIYTEGLNECIYSLNFGTVESWYGGIYVYIFVR